MLGVQFYALFTDDLYFEIGRHAIEMAELLKSVLVKKGCKFYLDSPTNQQFIVLEDDKLELLKGKVGYSFWEKPDATHTVIRLSTGWSTTAEDIKELEKYI